MNLLYWPVITVIISVVSESQVGILVVSQHAPLLLHPHLIAGAHHVSHGHSVWLTPHSASPVIILQGEYILHEYIDVLM